MNIRRELLKDERLQIYPGYKQIFLGEEIGIGLSVQAGVASSSHICFHVLRDVYDDGYWFEEKGALSSACIEEYIEVLQAVQKWMEENAFPDYIGEARYGWKFKLEDV